MATAPSWGLVWKCNSKHLDLHPYLHRSLDRHCTSYPQTSDESSDKHQTWLWLSTQVYHSARGSTPHGIFWRVSLYSCAFICWALLQTHQSTDVMTFHTDVWPVATTSSQKWCPLQYLSYLNKGNIHRYMIYENDLPGTTDVVVWAVCIFQQAWILILGCWSACIMCWNPPLL